MMGAFSAGAWGHYGYGGVKGEHVDQQVLLRTRVRGPARASRAFPYPPPRESLGNPWQIETCVNSSKKCKIVILTFSHFPLQETTGISFVRAPRPRAWPWGAIKPALRRPTSVRRAEIQREVIVEKEVFSP